MASLNLFHRKKEKKQAAGELHQEKGRVEQAQEEEKEEHELCFFSDLEENMCILKDVFGFPENSDFVMRKLELSSLKKKGVMVYLNGTINTNIVEKEILYPLIQPQRAEGAINNISEHIEEIMQDMVTVKNVVKLAHFNEAVSNIVNGNVVLFIQGENYAISMSTAGFAHRGIEKPSNENVIKGPKEAFIESAEVNRSLIRRQIKDPRLITESIEVGERARNYISVMYMKDIANTEVVEKVKNRLLNIKADCVQNIGLLEQYIEERPYSLFPTLLYTERPDRAAAFLLEGHVVLIMDSSPACLVAPVTFWAFFHTSEDQYQRWAYGNFIRFIRVIAFLIALLTPALYLASTNYHAEMIPSDLVLAIAGTRETLPFPALVEVLLMDISFELIREAGTRIPITIGPTIGIVGALILGQAAVEANVVSPILVIIIAITGLASFAIPEVSFTYLIRIAKLFFILSAAFMGFLGIATFGTAFYAYMISINSFGVSYLSPVAPSVPSSQDTVRRATIWKQWIRPLNMRPKDKKRRT